MKHLFNAILIAMVALLTFVSAATAATSYPSVVGDWLLEGKASAKACVKGYGCGKSVSGLYENVTFDSDNSFSSDQDYYGSWTQVKNKITVILNDSEFEEMVNDFIYSETGLDVYVNVTSMMINAKISKDGSSLAGGKLYVKYEFYYDVIHGTGALTNTFKGSRTGNSILGMAAVFPADEQEDQTPPLVSIFGRMLIEKFLQNNGK